MEILSRRRLCKFQVVFFANGSRFRGSSFFWFTYYYCASYVAFSHLERKDGDLRFTINETVIVFPIRFPDPSFVTRDLLNYCLHFYFKAKNYTTKPIISIFPAPSFQLQARKEERKKKKKIPRAWNFAKIYDTGSFAKVARGDTVERGWRAFDKWIEITNYPRPFRRGSLLIKSDDWFSLKSSVNVRSW